MDFADDLFAFGKIWIPSIIFLAVVASAVGDASLDSIGEGTVEA